MNTTKAETNKCQYCGSSGFHYETCSRYGCKTVTGEGNAPRTKYEVTMDSITYGAEIFEYDTLREAYEAVSRLALKCRDLKDEIVRTFYVSEV